MNAAAYPDATKDEYLDDRLHRAAEIVWLWVCGDTGREDDELWPDGWVEQTMGHLRAVLYGEPFYDADDVPFWVYWRALEILNLPRAYASSSARAERASDPEPDVIADFDPVTVTA